MKKLFAVTVAFSMIAAAGVAGATTFWNPRFTDIGKLRTAGESVVKKASKILRRARVQARRGRRFGWTRGYAMSKVRKLKQAAMKFRAINFRSSGATVAITYRRLVSRFNQAKKVFKWMRPRSKARAVFASIGSDIRSMKYAVRRIVTNAYRPYPRFRPTVKFRKFPRFAPKVRVKTFPRYVPRAKATVTYIPYGSNQPVAYAAAPSPNYMYRAPGFVTPSVTVYQPY